MLGAASVAMGSLDIFAALDTSGRFGKPGRSLQPARSGKFGTKPTLIFLTLLTQHASAGETAIFLAVQQNLSNKPFKWGIAPRIRRAKLMGLK
ncbi:MAG: hypothetical protein ABJV60_03735 [Lentilitoribacter sp.]